MGVTSSLGANPLAAASALWDQSTDRTYQVAPAPALVCSVLAAPALGSMAAQAPAQPGSTVSSAAAIPFTHTAFTARTTTPPAGGECTATIPRATAEFEFKGTPPAPTRSASPAAATRLVRWPTFSSERLQWG